MPKRLVISVEFSKNKPEELELYLKLIKHSSSSGLIKDILKGLIPVSVLHQD